MKCLSRASERSRGRERGRYLQEFNASRSELARLREECNAAKPDVEKVRNENAQERHRESIMREGAGSVADMRERGLVQEIDRLMQKINTMIYPWNGSEGGEASSLVSQ